MTIINPSLSSNSNSDIHDLFPKYGLPIGLLPNAVNTQESEPQSETLETPISAQDQEEVGEEEEEGECPFCVYMKAGACKETFIEWEKCVEEGEKNGEDIVDKCFRVTDLLKQCMEANPDHYAPILEAQKVAEKTAIDELEKEKATEARNQEKQSESS